MFTQNISIISFQLDFFVAQKGVNFAGNSCAFWDIMKEKFYGANCATVACLPVAMLKKTIKNAKSEVKKLVCEIFMGI